MSQLCSYQYFLPFFILLYYLLIALIFFSFCFVWSGIVLSLTLILPMGFYIVVSSQYTSRIFTKILEKVVFSSNPSKTIDQQKRYQQVHHQFTEGLQVLLLDIKSKLELHCATLFIQLYLQQYRVISLNIILFTSTPIGSTFILYDSYFTPDAQYSQLQFYYCTSLPISTIIHIPILSYMILRWVLV